MTATVQQRVALDKGNSRRIAAATLKAQVASGSKTFRDAIEDPDAGCITIGALLRAQPRWGRSKAISALKRVERDGRTRISDWRRVDELTARERARLVEVVEGGNA